MKAYISGQIDDLDKGQLEARFDSASEMLELLGIEPVKPIISMSEQWSEQLIHNVKLLLECDAILLLDDWMNSKESRIHKCIAEECQKVILHESMIHEQHDKLNKITAAIESVTSLKFCDYTSQSKRRDTYYARMLLANYLKKEHGMTAISIADLLNRDHATICCALAKYDDEYAYNKQFRDMANKIKSILSK